jgi:hypothetical protein
MNVVSFVAKRPVTEVLALAAEEDDVLIIGKRDGQLSLWTSDISDEEINWWLDLVKLDLLQPYLSQGEE